VRVAAACFSFLTTVTDSPTPSRGTLDDPLAWHPGYVGPYVAVNQLLAYAIWLAIVQFHV